MMLNVGGPLLNRGMNSIVARLQNLEENLDSVAHDAFAGEMIPDLSDVDVAELLAITGRLQRRLDSLQIESTLQVRQRSEGMCDNKMTLAYGCSRPADLVRMLIGSDSRNATRLVKAAGRVRRERSVTEGSFLPARYQALREAMEEGHLGLDGLLAATDSLEQSARRISDEARIEADRQLADFARGVDADAESVPGPAPLPEDLAVLSRVLVAYLDPDGAEPDENVGLRGRSFTIGPLRDGAVPVRGNLLPEVAGQLKLLFDSLLNPRVDSPENPEQSGVQFVPSDEVAADHALEAPEFTDLRTRAQKQHDALASILNTAAGTDLFPHLGGAAPTLVISSSATEYAEGNGWAQVANTGDLVSQRVAEQAACAGGIQRVLFDENGRIASVGTSARIFNALQRRAISLRDGGCVIPGCTIPVAWCEIHHVTEHAVGGATHTDNGTRCKSVLNFAHSQLLLSELRLPKETIPRITERSST